MSIRVYFATLVVLAGAAVCLADQPLIPVEIYVQRTAKMRVEVFAPPLLFEYGKITDEAKKPEWYDAYYAYQRMNEFEYKNWAQYFAPACLKAINIDASSFAEKKARYNKDTFSHPESTALYAVYAVFDGRELCHVVMYNFSHLKAQPDGKSKLKYPLSSLAFEKIDNIWKLQDVLATDWSQGLPFTHPDQIEEIIEKQKAVQDLEKQVHPMK